MGSYQNAAGFTSSGTLGSGCKDKFLNFEFLELKGKKKKNELWLLKDRNVAGEFCSVSSVLLTPVNKQTPYEPVDVGSLLEPIRIFGSRTNIPLSRHFASSCSYSNGGNDFNGLW